MSDVTQRDQCWHNHDHRMHCHRVLIGVPWYTQKTWPSILVIVLDTKITYHCQRTLTGLLKFHFWRRLEVDLVYAVLERRPGFIRRWTWVQFRLYHNNAIRRQMFSLAVKVALWYCSQCHMGVHTDRLSTKSHEVGHVAVYKVAVDGRRSLPVTTHCARHLTWHNKINMF